MCASGCARDRLSPRDTLPRGPRFPLRNPPTPRPNPPPQGGGTLGNVMDFVVVITRPLMPRGLRVVAGAWVPFPRGRRGMRLRGGLRPRPKGGRRVRVMYVEFEGGRGPSFFSPSVDKENFFLVGGLRVTAHLPPYTIGAHHSHVFPTPSPPQGRNRWRAPGRSHVPGRLHRLRAPPPPGARSGPNPPAGDRGGAGRARPQGNRCPRQTRADEVTHNELQNSGTLS